MPRKHTPKPTTGRPLNEAEPATSIIVLRVQPSRKAGYVKAAAPGTLSAWALRNLDAAAADAAATYKAQILERAVGRWETITTGAQSNCHTAIERWSGEEIHDDLNCETGVLLEGGAFKARIVPAD